MTAIPDLSALVNRLSGGNSGTPQNLWFHKTARAAGAAPTNPVAGRLWSLWGLDGQPSGGVAPTTVAIPDNTTAGSLKQASPGGAREQFMHSVWATCQVAGTLILYDRLLHIGNLNGTVTTAQTVGGTLTRNTGGLGNFVMAEVYTAVGATGTTISMSYTNQAGTAGRTGQATTFGGTGFNAQFRSILLPLASGDTGVQAVASVTVAATTGTAGNFGVTVGNPLAIIDVPGPGLIGGRTFAQGLPGLPKVPAGACLAWLFMPNSTTVPEFMGGLSLVEN